MRPRIRSVFIDEKKLRSVPGVRLLLRVDIMGDALAEELQRHGHRLQRDELAVLHCRIEAADIRRHAEQAVGVAVDLTPGDDRCRFRSLGVEGRSIGA